MAKGKSSGSKAAGNTPRHNEHNARGSEQNPYDQRPSKADLLARMKAAAEKNKKD